MPRPDFVQIGLSPAISRLIFIQTAGQILTTLGKRPNTFLIGCMRVFITEFCKSAVTTSRLATALATSSSPNLDFNVASRFHKHQFTHHIHDVIEPGGIDAYRGFRLRRDLMPALSAACAGVAAGLILLVSFQNSGLKLVL